MYLHEDREAFQDIIELVSSEIGRTPIVVDFHMIPYLV